MRALLAQHVDVNATQGDGATALHWAAHFDDLSMADSLIRAGARVGAADDTGVTPLYLACIEPQPSDGREASRGRRESERGVDERRDGADDVRADR